MSIIRGQLVGDVVSGSTFAGIVTATVFEGNGNIGILTVATVSAGGTTGTGEQYLRSTGTGVTWSNISFPPQQVGTSRSDSTIIGFNSTGERLDDANGRLSLFGGGNFRVYRTSGTFTVEPGISSIRVRVIGAGGNGGNGGVPYFASPGPSNIVPGAGSGGGGGGYAHKVITSFPAPRTYAVTVGFPGGGTSSFGSEVSATGGTNASNQVRGVGGSGSGGDVNYIGATGIHALQTIPGAIGGPPIPAFGIEPILVSTSGCGGASATQLGNASGRDVPGISNFLFPPAGYSVRRFPFDIFEGFPGDATNIFGFVDGSSFSGSAGSRPGFEGGGGGSGPNAPVSNGPFPGKQGGTGAGGGQGGTPYQVGNPGGPGGAGGIGGGGGGGGPAFYFPLGTGGVGGPGGPGLVIVEW